MARPRIRDPDEKEPRQYVGGAIPLSLKLELQAAAKKNGRSLSAEWQSRIEQSLRDDRVLALLSEISAAMRDDLRALANQFYLHGGILQRLDAVLQRLDRAAGD